MNKMTRGHMENQQHEQTTGMEKGIQESYALKFQVHNVQTARVSCG